MAAGGHHHRAGRKQGQGLGGETFRVDAYENDFMWQFRLVFMATESTENSENFIVSVLSVDSVAIFLYRQHQAALAVHQGDGHR
jgi:hypothetical protein